MKKLGMAFGVLGVISCFLPFILGISFWHLRGAEGGWHVWATLAAFATAALVQQGTRTGALIGAAAFGFVAFKVFGTDAWMIVKHGSIGAILMVVAAIGGFVASLSSLVSREP
jgi:hypothetical protein